MLDAHQDVVESAVIGVSDDRYGEVGLAVVVVRDGAAVSADEIVATARRNLGNFKVPKYWRITTEPLPRTVAGKVQKFVLRRSAMDNGFAQLAPTPQSPPS